MYCHNFNNYVLLIFTALRMRRSCYGSSVHVSFVIYFKMAALDDIPQVVKGTVDNASGKLNDSVEDASPQLSSSGSHLQSQVSLCQCHKL